MIALSQVPGNPSFRNSAINAVAVIPLLSSNGDDTSTRSAGSFRDLFEALQRHTQQGTQQQQCSLETISTVDDQSRSQREQEDLLLVVPNSSLTRPGDWRYNETPLKSFHWQHGCQRLHVFDGRPHNSRKAHDRLINHELTRHWIDVCPSRRTAAVIGVLNVHDCSDLSDLHRAEEELHQWAERFAMPPYEVTAHGRSFDRDQPVERLFVYDSFDEECQKIDLSKSTMGTSILAFPPTDEAHSVMMDLHLNLVINDLAVAIFCDLENKIRQSDVLGKEASNQPQQTISRISFARIISGSSDKESDEPIQASKTLNVSSMASLVSPDSKLAKDVAPEKKSSFGSFSDTSSVLKSTASSVVTKDTKPPNAADHIMSKPLLMTPMDDDWNLSELSARDAEEIRKRDTGRREKYAADLSLLSGSPLDAYERYLKAAELCRTGVPDPVWYAFALEGCAAAHIAMAEAGGYSVDEYLENNFQLPDDVMALAKKETKEEKRQANYSNKQTLPEIVFAVCDEALQITNRHTLLAPFHAELLLKLAAYCAGQAEGHLRCRWGEGDGCYGGEQGEAPRWLRTSVSRMKFSDLRTRDGSGDMITINTFNRTRKVCELLNEAVSVGSLAASTRVDIATFCARICLIGVMPTRWKGVPSAPLKLPRKAAFYMVVAAEAAGSLSKSTTNHPARKFWLLASQLYTKCAENGKIDRCYYGWASLRASCLDALSMQGINSLSLEASIQLLCLLGEMSPVLSDIKPKASTDTKTQGEATPSEEGTVPISRSLKDSAPDKIDTEAPEPLTTASQFAKQLRESLTNMTGNSSLLTLQSQWASDDPVPPVLVPLGDKAAPSASLLAVKCVWSNVDGKTCTMLQKSCIDRITSLQRSLPASSSFGIQSYSTNTDHGKTLPLYVASAMAIAAESALELECVEKTVKKKVENAAMATFFNPYDKEKKPDKSHKIRVAADEGRTMSIQFGNRLSVPLEVRRSQLVFDDGGTGRIKADALTFVVPAKAESFTVHFPFTVLSRPFAAPEDDVGSNRDTFEVKGISLTCFGRSHFLPIQSLNDPLGLGRPGRLPDSASAYPHRPVKTDSGKQDEAKPVVESYPGQPWLQLYFVESGAPIETISISLSDGGVFAIPPFLVENYAGPKGRGRIEQLEVTAFGLPGQPNKKLFDSTIGHDTAESEYEFVKDLVEDENPVPLKIRAIADKLSLDGINDFQGKDCEEKRISFQVAASHNMSKLRPEGTTIQIKIRYRGLTNVAAEVWRKREISLHVQSVKGPRISSIAFRPDLGNQSAFTEMCKAIQHSIPTEANLRGGSVTKSDGDYMTTRVGQDQCINVCGEKSILVLTVANETNSAITLTSRDGPVCGFDNYLMPEIVVYPGVSAKLPVVIPRFPRLDKDGKATELVNALVAKTRLVWTSQRGSGLGLEVSRGYIRIPPTCLREIVEFKPSFVNYLCEPPCQIHLLVDNKPSSATDLLTVAPGSPIDVSVVVTVSSWIPVSIRELCTVTMELVCTRRDQMSSMPIAEDQLRDFIWVGKLQQKSLLSSDAEQLKHRMKLVMCQPGDFLVSACLRITQIKTRVDDKLDGPVGHVTRTAPMQEIWWAPVAQPITVEPSKFPPQ